MTPVQSPGTTANRAGKQLEEAIAGIVAGRGYQKVESRMFFAMRSMEQAIYAQQVEIGKDIYAKKRRIDIMLYHPRMYPESLVIQCKWQASSGSVEEKYPYEVLSIRLNEYDTIIVIDGGGYSDGALRWLQGQAGKGQLKHVFSHGDFARFASSGRI